MFVDLNLMGYSFPQMFNKVMNLSWIVMQQTSYPQNKVPTNQENVFNSQTLPLTKKNKYSTVLFILLTSCLRNSTCYTCA